MWFSPGGWNSNTALRSSSEASSISLHNNITFMKFLWSKLRNFFNYVRNKEFGVAWKSCFLLHHNFDNIREYCSIFLSNVLLIRIWFNIWLDYFDNIREYCSISLSKFLLIRIWFVWLSSCYWKSFQLGFHIWFFVAFTRSFRRFQIWYLCSPILF